MKTKFLFTILFISSLINNGFGQYNNFDLSDYKLPDLKRKSLDTYFNLSGNNGTIKFNTTYNGDVRNQKINSNAFDGNILLNYSSLINSPSLQRESSLSTQLAAQNVQQKAFSTDLDYGYGYGGYEYGYSYSNYDYEKLQKSFHYNPAIRYSLTNRNYYRPNFFNETDLVVNYRFNRMKNTRKDETIYYTDTRTINSLAVYVPLKIGIGRIEPVQDARHALYILDELKKANRLSADLSTEEIIHLARHISQLKNERFFDTRVRQMQEIESIDSFMVANNYVAQHDARYFTTLTDIWMYGNQPQRNSGTRISAALYPGYSFANYKNISEGDFEGEIKQLVNAFYIHGGFEFLREKPMNLNWQNTISLNAYAGTIRGNYGPSAEFDDLTINMPNIQFNFAQTIGYYPNTRTDFQFTYSARYLQMINSREDDETVIGMDGKGVAVGANLSINYYISPQLRINALTMLNYMWQDNYLIFPVGNIHPLNQYAQINSFAFGPYNTTIERNLTHFFEIKLVYSIF
jgi:hypothetical protein